MQNQRKTLLQTRADAAPTLGPPHSAGRSESGFGPWFLILPVALLLAIVVPMMLSLHPLWGVAIYMGCGISLGLCLAVFAAITPQSAPTTRQSQPETPPR